MKRKITLNVDLEFLKVRMAEEKTDYIFCEEPTEQNERDENRKLIDEAKKITDEEAIKKLERIIQYLLEANPFYLGECESEKEEQNGVCESKLNDDYIRG